MLKGHKKSEQAIKSELLDVTLGCDGGQQLQAYKLYLAKGALEDQVKNLEKHMAAVPSYYIGQLLTYW